MFKKILLSVIVLSILLSFFGAVDTSQSLNAAISPTLPQERRGVEGKEDELCLSAVSLAEVMSYESSIGGAGEETHPYNPIHYSPSPYPSEDNEQIDLFDLYLFKEYFAQEKVDFKLPISDSFALVTNFPSLKKQEEGNSPLPLVNFDQNALVGLRYTHQGAIWDTKIKVVTGLANPNGGYGFTFCLTKNF